MNFVEDVARGVRSGSEASRKRRRRRRRRRRRGQSAAAAAAAAAAASSSSQRPQTAVMRVEVLDDEELCSLSTKRGT